MKYIKNFRMFESMVKKDEDTEIFNYKSLVEQAWRPIIMKAQKFQNINFDLENNSSTGQKATLYIKKNLRKDQPIKYEFNCELFCAGGDWECPVLYFRVEFTHEFIRRTTVDETPEYVFDVHEEVSGKLSRCYVFIPGPEDGNHLAKTEKGWTAWTRDYLEDEGLKEKDVKITDEDKKKAWKWIESSLTKIVEDRHEMLDEPDKTEITDPNK
jgi:hypothetical protein